MTQKPQITFEIEETIVLKQGGKAPNVGLGASNVGLGAPNVGLGAPKSTSVLTSP